MSKERCAPLDHNYQVSTQTIPTAYYKATYRTVICCTKCGHYFFGPKEEGFHASTGTYWTWNNPNTNWAPLTMNAGTSTISFGLDATVAQ